MKKQHLLEEIVKWLLVYYLVPLKPADLDNKKEERRKKKLNKINWNNLEFNWARKLGCMCLMKHSLMLTKPEQFGETWEVDSSTVETEKLDWRVLSLCTTPQSVIPSFCLAAL